MSQQHNFDFSLNLYYSTTATIIDVPIAAAAMASKTTTSEKAKTWLFSIAIIRQKGKPLTVHFPDVNSKSIA